MPSSILYLLESWTNRFNLPDICTSKMNKTHSAEDIYNCRWNICSTKISIHTIIMHFKLIILLVSHRTLLFCERAQKIDSAVRDRADNTISRCPGFAIARNITPIAPLGRYRFDNDPNTTRPLEHSVKVLARFLLNRSSTRIGWRLHRVLTIGVLVALVCTTLWSSGSVQLKHAGCVMR